MEKNFEKLLTRQREIEAEMQNANDEQFAALKRESEINEVAMANINLQREYAKNAPAQPQKSANELMREAVKAVRTHQMEGDIVLKRDATAAISSAVINSGEKTNMESAGLPVTIGDLINPLEMETIYNKLGLQVATGVRGTIQWPALDTAAEVSVGGELDEVSASTLDFSKITATPVKLGISIEVSNEAVNDASFDLVGTITAQMNKAIGRTLNKRVLALAAPSTKASFVGPLVSHKQNGTIAGTAPTYAELKAMKGKVLATGAQMSGFCYVMDAAMYSTLEASAKESGAGLFIIENGKIDGDPVFITDLAAYSGKVVAGCFGYVALNQHGDVHFIVDPYTKAKANATVFTLSADFSITYLWSGNKHPFVVA